MGMLNIFADLFHADTPMYGFKHGNSVPGQGTRDMAFQPRFFLPPNALMGYGGVDYTTYFREMQPPQVFHNFKVRTASAGAQGIIAGTVYGAPLLVGQNSG